MSRLIEADEAKKNVCKWECGGEPDCPLNKPDVYTHEKCNSMRAIDETPTVDAIYVVRCKDCKWWDKVDNIDGVNYGTCERKCTAIRKDAFPNENWFCADGEKVTK